ncbi:Biotin carboxyl carrier protein of acetyl-CoA carboxylase [Candidatus Moranella endobia PCVAL]|uniref:Biotin carboxyl carrier protein of acetyl-CoA carboxylase n=1 Tax=Moranella endobia (strain PCIT) TaxID=903503 RepID=F7XXQ6_MOREP|nr:acetyl-CoA carboxylase biotin carboxyl carrier protein [Candidatus Moranella endobia]AEI74882.1 acetyl-CoA carboxylase, biotin carboxyl carrier protein [Candidatus Moranella endobia PCIT]AGJ61128.1 Biotin carboxyl carrier protein of acetyl-CoA carboxylase [Candidatus Moranella endobia PCVAL]
MDLRKIKKLIELIEKSGIATLEISEGEESIRINRALMQQTYLPQTNISAGQQSSTTPVTLSATTSGHLVRSPMVGIFYRTPSPDAKSFVEVGQKVDVGDTICIIEAMKIMNQIASDKKGVVKAILRENGQLVEFDEPLIVIE